MTLHVSTKALVLLGILLASPAWAQEDEEPTPQESPGSVTVVPDDAAPAADPPAEEPAAPSADEEATPQEAPADAPPATTPPPAEEDLPRLLIDRSMVERGHAVQEQGGVANPLAPPQDVALNPRAVIRLKLKDGRTVEGILVAEAPEGYALILPTGETRFFDRLDVVREGGTTASPTVLEKLTLLPSLAWPGIGQVIYGLAIQGGNVFARSALWVGVVLAVVGLASLSVAVAGVGLGLALPKEWLGSTPFNAVTLAGVMGLGLAFAVGAVDAGARAILD